MIVTLDIDLQNNPSDIIMMLKKFYESYDVVHEWGEKRQYKALTRLFSSKIANLLILCLTSIEIHDYGFSFKAYSAELVRNMIFMESHTVSDHI